MTEGEIADSPFAQPVRSGVRRLDLAVTVISDTAQEKPKP